MSGAPPVVTPTLATLRQRRGRKWSQYPADVLPAWIADMDYLPAPPIRDALLRAVEGGDLGYGPAGPSSGMPESFCRWAQRRWDWQIEPESILVVPDVVGGLANCVEALTEAGDAILVQTPIYPPFLSCVPRGGRHLVSVPLAGNQIDFTELESSLVAHNVRMVLLCNPHNPSGRSFAPTELQCLATLADELDLVVVSDEVHADLVYPPRRHTPFASLGVAAARRTVTLNSASKAFNVAGLRAAVCVAQDPGLRGRLRALSPQRWTSFSTLGVAASLAAWTDEGEAWLTACVAQLATLRDHLMKRLESSCRGIRCASPEAGYLAWLDCRELGLGAEPAEFFLAHARVALSEGREFGEPGAGHARLNFATSREILDQVLDRMASACARGAAPPAPGAVPSPLQRVLSL